jgi:hypothetical protein
VASGRLGEASDEQRRIPKRHRHDPVPDAAPRLDEGVAAEVEDVLRSYLGFEAAERAWGGAP